MATFALSLKNRAFPYDTLTPMYLENHGLPYDRACQNRGLVGDSLLQVLCLCGSIMCPLYSSHTKLTNGL
jgi:hypothetical protein